MTLHESWKGFLVLRLLPKFQVGMGFFCYVDVMGYVRKLIKSKTAGLKTFGDACKCFCDLTMGLCRYASRIHYIFDSYHQSRILKDREGQVMVK